jgi:hypothetical protein
MKFSPISLEISDPKAPRPMSAIILFEEKQVRRAWNKDEEKWYFAIADVIAVLTGSVDSGAYWRKLKERLKKEGNQTVTDCHGLKMTAAELQNPARGQSADPAKEKSEPLNTHPSGIQYQKFRIFFEGRTAFDLPQSVSSAA